MQQDTLGRLIKEYREAYDAIPREALELDLRVTIKTIQALAKGKPVSLAQLANIWDMPLEQVQAILEQAEENGRGPPVGGLELLVPVSESLIEFVFRPPVKVAHDDEY